MLLKVCVIKNVCVYIYIYIKWWWGGIVREFGMDIYTLLYLKWITEGHTIYTVRSLPCTPFA